MAVIGALSVVPSTWQLQTGVRAATANKPLRVVVLHALLSIVIQSAGAAIGLFSRYRASEDVGRGVVHLRSTVLRLVLSQQIADTKGESAAEPQSIVVVDIDRIDQYADQLLGGLVPGTLLIAVGSALAVTRSSFIGILTMLTGLPVFWFVVFTARRARKATLEYWEGHRLISRRVLRLMQARELIAAHDGQRVVARNEEPHLQRYSRQSANMKLRSAVSITAQTVGFGSLSAVLLVVAAKQLSTKAIALDQLFVLLFSLVVIQSGVRLTVTAQSAVTAGGAALSRIERLIAEASRSTTTAAEIDPRSTLPIDELEAVDLSYSVPLNIPGTQLQENRVLFSGVSLRICRGDKIHLTGANGTGKTTLLLMLAQQCQPQSGTFRINGEIASAEDLQAVKRRIAYVAQNVVLVEGTVAENLRLLGDDATDAELTELLHDVGIRFDLDHQIGSEGQTMSGGERQRLAIARALLGDPDIVLLDEPSNHLDVDLPRFLADIDRHLRNRAVVVVSHGDDLSSLGYRPFCLS
jgi:ABC-type transport system involved in cytochrome bd biosynthesis fused ATPase/permease subunit